MAECPTTPPLFGFNRGLVGGGRAAGGAASHTDTAYTTYTSGKTLTLDYPLNR
jgi:hypothetical protein